MRVFGCPQYDYFLLVFTIKEAADVFHDDENGLTPYEPEQLAEMAKVHDVSSRSSTSTGGDSDSDSDSPINRGLTLGDLQHHFHTKKCS